MIQKLVLAMAVAVALIACGTSKSASAPDKHEFTVSDGDDMITIAEPDISQAEIDSLQHQAARKAMEEGEFILLISYVNYEGRGGYVIPRFNFLEVTDNKMFYQIDCIPKKEPVRFAERINKKRYTDKTTFDLSITPGSVVVSLLPGSNRAVASVTWASVEGIILPRNAALSLITKNSKPSRSESHDALN